jgi:Inner membrane protein YgaP-like, transmembrane domain
VSRSYRNVPRFERLARVAGGGLFLALAFTRLLPESYPAAAVLLGVVLVATGLVGWCPLYAVLKAGTRRS